MSKYRRGLCIYSATCVTTLCIAFVVELSIGKGTKYDKVSALHTAEADKKAAQVYISHPHNSHTANAAHGGAAAGSVGNVVSVSVASSRSSYKQYTLLKNLKRQCPAVITGHTTTASKDTTGTAMVKSQSAVTNATTVTTTVTTCNVPILEVTFGSQPAIKGSSDGNPTVHYSELAQRLATATTPLLIRGLSHHPDWRAQLNTFGQGEVLVTKYGGEKMRLSVGALLSHGPESTVLDEAKLRYMQDAWSERFVPQEEEVEEVEEVEEAEEEEIAEKAKSNEEEEAEEEEEEEADLAKLQEQEEHQPHSQQTREQQGRWQSDSSNFRDKVLRQVRAGKARPVVTLADWMEVLQQGNAPPDSYVFQNVTGRRVSQGLDPLMALWRRTAVAAANQYKGQSQKMARPMAGTATAQDDAESAPPRSSAPSPPMPLPLTRLGIGGSGSGSPFHDHAVFALNMVFAGRKRWLITRPCQPDCKIPFYRNGTAVYHPTRLLREKHLAAQALRTLAPAAIPQKKVAANAGTVAGISASTSTNTSTTYAATRRGKNNGSGGNGDGDATLADSSDTTSAISTSWDCVQRPGELVLVPEGFLHATVNLDSATVSVAMQCNDGVDPREGLSHLNALIVHASAAAAAPGPCGNAWASPFGNDMGVDEALSILARLPDSFRGDPRIYLNRPMLGDGCIPTDVVVQYGSVQVASALLAHGARFPSRHRQMALQKGYGALAEMIKG